ncbi:hypothetical protein CMPELA_25725 [Cupriavidus necator]|uniref:Uncharacterized protein n=1 Tax=Cupriavidus necator (strain ATCC 17699 / DSM 428 / KCTC 22496 / NCIMB 10442 / H16 / Stanier 337) TaxID=381666 RepID=Q0K1L4_CUPNH|nr:Hypothetical protein H16_B1320 [Cupriavidus necator H16]
MSEIKNAIKTTALVLAVIYVARRVPVANQIVATALAG